MTYFFGACGAHHLLMHIVDYAALKELEGGVFVVHNRAKTRRRRRKFELFLVKIEVNRAEGARNFWYLASLHKGFSRRRREKI